MINKLANKEIDDLLALEKAKNDEMQANLKFEISDEELFKIRHDKQPLIAKEFEFKLTQERRKMDLESQDALKNRSKLDKDYDRKYQNKVRDYDLDLTKQKRDLNKKYKDDIKKSKQTSETQKKDKIARLKAEYKQKLEKEHIARLGRVQTLKVQQNGKLDDDLIEFEEQLKLKIDDEKRNVNKQLEQNEEQRLNDMIKDILAKSK